MAKPLHSSIGPRNYHYLRNQIIALFKIAKAQTISDQVEKPGSEINVAAAELTAYTRLFDPESDKPSMLARPPLDEGQEHGISVSFDDLPTPKAAPAVKAAFAASLALLEARYNGDEHRLWEMQNKLRILKRDIERFEIDHEVPRAVPVYVETANQLALGHKSENWQTVMERILEERRNSLNSPPSQKR